MRSGGWVGLAGVRESKVCLRKVGIQTAQESASAHASKLVIMCFGRDNQMPKKISDFRLNQWRHFP